MNRMIETIRQFLQQRRNLASLIFFDFSQNFLSSYFGFAWAIIGPLVTLLILTLVFQVGFRVAPVSTTGLPFVVWLAAGMVPWLYFADGLSSSARAITSYAFLVRKASFRISFLPAVRLFAAGIIHLAMMVFLVGVLFYFDLYPTAYWLQWFIYAGLMFLLLLGIGWLTSSLAVFIPDVSSLLGIITSLGFWATPIFWSPTMVPDRWQWIFVVNPAYYIVQGYRDTFINQRWIWERPMMEHVAFGCWLLFFLWLGALTFRKLRPQFADVI